MHVLIISREFPPAVVGGVAYHSYYLTRALSARGHDVSVLTTSIGDHSDDSKAPTGATVERINYPTVFSPRLWFDLAVRRRLSGSQLLSEVDVIHSHEYVRFDHLATDTPAILKIHFNIARKLEYFPFDEYSPLVRPAVWAALTYGIAPLERGLAAQARDSSDAQLLVSELLRHSQGRSAVPAESHVVYNGVDATRFTTDESSAGKQYFLFVGGSQRRKGYDLIYSAFSKIDTPVKVVGTNPPNGHTPSNIDYLGYVSQGELPALYQGAKALIHPARYEPFGNVVLESLACGTPVIVTGPDHCGAAEILDESVAEFVHPTTEDVARAVREFDADCYSAADCRALAEQYTWDAVAERTEAIAASLLNGSADG